MTKLELNKSRTFHDSWAFLLFLFLTVALNSFYCASTPDILTKAYQFFFERNLVIFLATLLMLSLLATLTVLILCYSFPKLAILGSFIGYNLLFLMTILYSIKNSEPAIPIIIAVVSLIFDLVFYFTLLRNLNFAATVLRSTSKVLYLNAYTIFFSQFFTLVLTQILFIPSLVYHFDNHEYSQDMMSFAVFTLHLIWTAFVLHYASRVFASSLLLNEITKATNSFWQSIKIVLYSLGSISYGALIISFVLVLKSMLKKNQDDDRRRSSNTRSGAHVLVNCLACLLIVLLDMVANIIDCFNDLAFSYMAVHGTSYSESMKNSVQVSEIVHNKNIISLLSIRKIATLFNFSFAVLIFKFTFLFGPKLLPQNELIEFKIVFGVFSIFTTCFLAFMRSVSLLESSCLTMVYIAVAYPEEMEKYDSEFASIIRNINSGKSDMREEKEQYADHRVNSKVLG